MSATTTTLWASMPNPAILNDDLYQKQQAEIHRLIGERIQPDYPTAEAVVIRQQGIRYYPVIHTGYMQHPSFPQSLEEITPERMNRIYYGRIGCACGCRGEYSDDASKFARKLKYFLKNASQVHRNQVNEDGIGDGIFYIEVGERYDRYTGHYEPSHTHVIYTKSNSESK